MTKKGLSPLVGTVLLILIIISLALLIWTSVAPWLNLKLALARECKKAETSIKLEQVCKKGGIDPNNKFTWLNLSITLSRKNIESNIVDFQIGASSQWGDLVSARLGLKKNEIPKPNERKHYEFDILPYTGVILGGDFIIAPVVKVGEKEKICKYSKRVPLRFCESTRKKYGLDPNW